MQGFKISSHILTLAVSVSLSNFMILSRACTFSERPAQRPIATSVLTFPVQGQDYKTHCATVALAFGAIEAAIRPNGIGNSYQCVLYEERDDGSSCDLYDLEPGAVTLTDIKDCSTAAIGAVSAQAVDLSSAGGQQTTVGGTTAEKLANVAAVGSVVASELILPSTEECLAACALWIPDCTHVSLDPHAEGRPFRCSFHNNPPIGYTHSGPSTYFSIRPGPRMQNLSLGALSAVLGGTPGVPVDAGGETDAVPVDTPVDTSVETGNNDSQPGARSAAPAPMAAPGGALVPVVANTGVAEPSNAPDAAATPSSMEFGPPEARFIAPGPESVAPVSGPLDSDLEPLFHTPPGTCPRPPVSYIAAGKHQEKLNVNAQKVDIEQYGNLLGPDLKLDMTYVDLDNGAAYCVDQGSDTDTVVVGGTILFETEDGDCALPPHNAAGSPCCTIYMWQPNARGFYYDNCSMQMQMRADGVYYFETEMPGDESIVGWGADPEPHIHYDVMCTGCSPVATAGIFTGEYRWYSKFYTEQICTLGECGNTSEAVHLADSLGVIEGRDVYKYDLVVPYGGKQEKP